MELIDAFSICAASVRGKKDGPGPVMVSVHSRAKGAADHYWPWAIFFKILKFRQGSEGREGDDVL